MLKVEEVELEVDLQKKAPKSSILKICHLKKTKNETTERETSYESTIDISTIKTGGTVKFLEILIVKKAQISKRKAEVVVYSGLNEQQGDKLSAGYLVPSTKKLCGKPFSG